MKFKENILLFTLLPLFLLTTGASFVRFELKHDYLVAYNSTCDPVKSVCFKECLDDECTEVEYYSKVQKKATDLQTECGDDITDCTSAESCIPDVDTNCSVIFCSTEVDGEDSCDAVSEETSIEQNDPLPETQTSTSTNI